MGGIEANGTGVSADVEELGGVCPREVEANFFTSCSIKALLRLISLRIVVKSSILSVSPEVSDSNNFSTASDVLPEL